MSASLATREPVAIRTAAVAVLTVLVHLLVVRGWLPIEADSEAFVAALVDVVGFAVAAVWSRAAVTPVAAPDTSALLASALQRTPGPRDNDLEPLYPVEVDAPRPQHDLDPDLSIHPDDISGSRRI